MKKKPLIISYIMGLLILSSLTIINPKITSSDSEEYEELEPVWVRTFGKDSYDDEGRSVQQTDDGGYIVVGATESYGLGDEDIWLIKTNVTGFKQWNVTYGGMSSDKGYYVKQTMDGGYIITGYTSSFGVERQDLWLIKTDEYGVKQWDKIYGGSRYEQGWSVQQTSDEGFIVTGYTDSFGAGCEDIWLIKTDSDGNMEWNITLGGSDIDMGSSVLQTSDGGYIIIGITTSYNIGLCDIWLIKTNSSGNEQWNKTYGEGFVESSNLILQTSDGGFLIVGTTSASRYGNTEIWVIKTNSTGDIQWNKAFGEAYNEYGISGQENSDGEYVITGYRIIETETHNYCNIYLVKIDSSGNEQWIKTYGSDDWFIGISMQLTTNNSCIITGWTFYDNLGDLLLLEFDFDKTKEKSKNGLENDDKSDDIFPLGLLEVLIMIIALIILISLLYISKHQKREE